MTTCSLTSNSIYSLKCEKEDSGIDVIKFLEEFFILVAASFENSFNISRMLRPIEAKMHLMTREQRHGTAVLAAKTADVGDALGEISML